MKSYPRVYFELLTLGFSLVMGIGLSRVFLPIMAYELDPTGILVGFVLSAYFFSRAFVELPSGLVADKIGRRNLIAGGFLLTMVGSLICAFSNSIYVLILGTSILGLGSALFFISSTSLIFDLFKSEERGSAVGTFQGVEHIGMFLSAPVGAVAAGLMGFSNVFILTSIIFFFAFIVALLSRDLKKPNTKATIQSKSSTVKKSLAGLKNSSLLAINFVNLSRMVVGKGIMLTVLQLHLNTHLNMNLELIGLVMGVRSGGMIFATLICGRLSDRLGRKPLIIGGLLLGGVCLFLYTLASTFEEIVILAAFEGASAGFMFVALIVFMSELVPPSVRSGAIGLYRTFQDVGGVLGPIIFMLLYVVDVYTAFWTASILFFFNVIIVILIKKPLLRPDSTKKNSLAAVREDPKGAKEQDSGD